MGKQTAIRLSDDIDQRLKFLASRTGRTVTYYMREAITKHLDDLEDIYLAKQALQRLEDGEDYVMTSEEFWHGVENKVSGEG